MTLSEIVRSIRASRAEFSELFLRAQVHIPIRAVFDAVVTSGDNGQAFEEALRFSQRKGFFKQLLAEVVASSLHDGAIVSAAARADPGNLPLQAIQGFAARNQHPDVVRKGITRGMHWTVRVLVDGVGAGTGILVGPNLVLTAWHVIEPLFDWVGGQVVPNPEASVRLSVQFDNSLIQIPSGALAPRVVSSVQAHQNWCVIFSPCHQEELSRRLPNALGDLDGWWDYAIIRLQKTPGAERRWATLEEQAVVPGANADIVLFQHPGSQPLRFGNGRIVAPEPTSSAFLPRLRFLHEIDASEGSSGGPCFDQTFKLFGLHQGAWSRIGSELAVNRGIPISRVREHIIKHIKALPTPGPGESPEWTLNQHDPAAAEAPIIGCDDFQALVWKAALGKEPRILVIVGDDAVGKSFRVAILASLLADAGHLKVAIDGETVLQQAATGVAQAVCREAGGVLPSFRALADADSSPAVWLKEDVVTPLLAALDEARDGRQVWLFFKNLNKSAGRGTHTEELLLALLERTLHSDWLRVVVDGHDGSIPHAVRHLSETCLVERFNSDLATRHVAIYLQRALAAQDVLPAEGAIAVAAKFATMHFERTFATPRPGEERACAAARALRELPEQVVLARRILTGEDRRE